MSDYISDELKARVRSQAGDRCGYCRSHQKYVWGTLEIEHILPKSLGGRNEEANFALTVRRSWVAVGWHPPREET